MKPHRLASLLLSVPLSLLLAGEASAQASSTATSGLPAAPTSPGSPASRLAGTATGPSLAGMAGTTPALASGALPEPEMNWRDPAWLSRQRELSRWRYQLGLEQQAHGAPTLGTQPAMREAVWAGVSYDLTQKLRGGVETPVWQRDSGAAARNSMNFERPRKEGLASLRGAFSYDLSSQSRLTLRPQARRVMVSYSATW